MGKDNHHLNIELMKITAGDLVKTGTQVYEITFHIIEISIYVRAKNRVELQSIVDKIPIRWNYYSKSITTEKISCFNEKIKDPDNFGIAGLIRVGDKAYVRQGDLHSFNEIKIKPAPELPEGSN